MGEGKTRNMMRQVGPTGGMIPLQQRTGEDLGKKGPHDRMVTAVLTYLPLSLQHGCRCC